MFKNNTKLNRNNLILIFLGVGMLVAEIMLFLLLDLGFLPKYVWFDIAIITICVGVAFALPNYLSKSIFVWLILFLQIVLNIANIVIVSAANELFSFEMIGLAKIGLQVFDVTFIDFPKAICFVLLLILEIIVYVLITRKKEKPVCYKKKNLPIILALIVAFQAGGFGLFALQRSTLKEGDSTSQFYMFESDEYLYNNLSSKWECLERFGSGGFYAKNLYNVFAGKDTTEEMLNETAEYFASGELIKSDVFGLSEGNNYISVLLESVETFGIDPYFTPTLYRLFFEDGIYLRNFNVNNRTNISEGLALIGNYPRENPINYANKNVLEVLGNEYEDIAIADKLNNAGYKTTYVHNNVSWFYNRDKTHLANGVGFENDIFLEDMDKLEKWVDFNLDPDNDFYTWYNWTLDSLVMENYVEEMYPTNERFYTHFTTISSHGAYEERESMKPYYDTLLTDMEVENGNYEKMWEFLYSLGYVKPDDKYYLEMFHWYKAAVMDVDKAIEILFNHLETNNLLNNTTVLLFADHNAYYHGLSYIMKDLDYGATEYDTKLYNIPVVIWDTKLKNKIIENKNKSFVVDNNIVVYDNNYIAIDKFTSTYNLLPTMLDLLGVEYNPNFYLNTTIFNNEGYLEIFQPNVGGTPYFNDKVYLSFDNVKWKDKDVTDEDINKYKEDALTLFYKYLHIERLYNNPEILEKYNNIINSK